MEATVVQFPHPGAEHRPGKEDVFRWNADKHRRKFLRSPGAFVDVHDQRVETDIVFWGEWEAPSRVVERWPASGSLPRFLHEPFWETPVGDGFRQNTDPWVFGERLRYSNCKQASQKNLRELRVGSLVLFGSSLGDDFVVDTVFVAADSFAFTTGKPAPEAAGECFATCTIDALGTLDRAPEDFRVHLGATFEQPLHGMFSFMPCLPADATQTRFPRPTIKHDRLNPRSKQSPKGANDLIHLDEVRACWESVVEQVRHQDLELGVFAATPQFHSTTQAVRPQAARTRC
jgi:hypothetical protein